MQLAYVRKTSLPNQMNKLFQGQNLPFASIKSSFHSLLISTSRNIHIILQTDSLVTSITKNERKLVFLPGPFPSSLLFFQSLNSLFLLAALFLFCFASSGWLLDLCVFVPFICIRKGARKNVIINILSLF